VNISTGFVQLAELPQGFVHAFSELLTEQEVRFSAQMTDWVQQNEWRCGRILLRFLITGAYGVPVNSIIIHTRSDGQMVAETLVGQVCVSHARIPGVWVGATTLTQAIGVDLVNVADFPVDVNGAERSAEDWALLEALAKMTAKGLAWALSADCYPVNGLLTAPDGDAYRLVSLPNLPLDVCAVLLGPADLSWDVSVIDIISNINCGFNE